MTTAEKFSLRSGKNMIGRFYVTVECLDCDLCRELAPGVFARDESTGISYVARQPIGDQETIQAMEAVAGCCVDAICTDGDKFDWITVCAYQSHENASSSI